MRRSNNDSVICGSTAELSFHGTSTKTIHVGKFIYNCIIFSFAFHHSTKTTRRLSEIGRNCYVNMLDNSIWFSVRQEKRMMSLYLQELLDETVWKKDLIKFICWVSNKSLRWTVHCCRALKTSIHSEYYIVIAGLFKRMEGGASRRFQIHRFISFNMACRASSLTAKISQYNLVSLNFLFIWFNGQSGRNISVVIFNY